MPKQQFRRRPKTYINGAMARRRIVVSHVSKFSRKPDRPCNVLNQILKDSLQLSQKSDSFRIVIRTSLSKSLQRLFRNIHSVLRYLSGQVSGQW